MTSAAAAGAAVVCIAISVLFLAFVGRQENDGLQARVTASSNRVVPLVKQGRLPTVLPDGTDPAIQVLDAHNLVVASTRQLAGEPPITTLHPDRDHLRAQQTLCSPPGLRGCMTVVSFKSYQPDGDWLINMAVPVVPWYGNSIVLFLTVGVSVLLTAMVAVGVFRAVGKTLAPVEAIRTELAEITADGLHRRVPVPDCQDEVKLLAETANATLDRLENDNERLRRFTADASHDLRSPLTAIRTQVEEALMYPDDIHWKETATAVLAGTERLQSIVVDLLTLARLDADAPHACEPTDLALLTGAELDHRPHRVEIVRNLQEHVVIDCDRPRIIRLLANLLDNAERHADSQITVTVGANEGTATLEVIDDGAGIAPEHRETVFDRFTRLDASRSRDAGGTGLGLSIARQIAEAHAGTLTIQDSPRGARFVLRLPHTGTGPTTANTADPECSQSSTR